MNKELLEQAIIWSTVLSNDDNSYDEDPEEEDTVTKITIRITVE